MEKNYGIRISGGQVSAGAMAAGEGATATNVSAVSAGSLTEARAGMAQLLELLHAHAERLDRPDEAIAVAELADRELSKEEPDKVSVLRLLELIASGAKSIASIGGAVTAVQQAVSAIF
ncbi:hypothetical protein [Kribbella shirazensis]|uniref:Menaquinone-dependent protoporphyrinogen IX oxidase n=1 Tax=Kribbella shirazensis TaxID=1105143 RepID=A0A7X5VAA9_9ACTN|nr:hypothetical protein [Kribbella shirazensis]NIK57329.1 menaquinone-dependent protoporphyrinogen IX oxidase [Kribbella shirazensis]